MILKCGHYTIELPKELKIAKFPILLIPCTVTTLCNCSGGR